MGDNTAISWCDATVNFWWGCTPWDIGCARCYASSWAARWGFDVFGHGKERRQISDATIGRTMRKLRKRSADWTRRPRVFAQSMSDSLDAEFTVMAGSRGWDGSGHCLYSTAV